MKTASAPLLSLDAVERVYGRGAQAVRSLGPVSFDIARGELVAIMGPSGSGKSTLLALVGALDRPSEGRILWETRALDTFTLDECAALRRRSVGFVFQAFNLLPGLTALENVALPLELDGITTAAARQLASEALKRMKLSHLEKRFPDDLSGGEQQRVAIARAFIGDRQLLLADEPTGALDSLTGEIVMRALREHCDEGRTAIVATHNAAHAAWADRVLFLRDGLLVDALPSAPSEVQAVR